MTTWWPLAACHRSRAHLRSDLAGSQAGSVLPPERDDRRRLAAGEEPHEQPPLPLVTGTATGGGEQQAGEVEPRGTEQRPGAGNLAEEAGHRVAEGDRAVEVEGCDCDIRHRGA
ncbi:MAG: hypothetical protein M5T61_04100 [Acidimicrobiia bacterium]|nr:hypothetical protein [Acidimicrobiia bacterium]